MATRHKAVKATLETGFATEWNDDHEINFAAEIHHKDVFMDFNAVNEWNLGQETSTTATTITLVGGFVAARLHAAGGAGNFSSIRHMLIGAPADITNHTALPEMTMAIDVQTPTADNATHEFGLFSSANALFAANQNGCFFRIDNNVLFAVSSDGAAETATNLGAPSQFAVYRVVHGAATDYFYVDDMVTAAATHTTDISGANLTMKLTCADRAGGDNYLNCQAVCLCTLRQTS